MCSAIFSNHHGQRDTALHFREARLLRIPWFLTICHQRRCNIFVRAPDGRRRFLRENAGVQEESEENYG